MVTAKKGTPKKTVSKPKRELEKNGIPKCLWSKIDGLASTFVENESDASDLKNKVTFTNESISIRDKEGNKKEYILFSASEKKLAEFATKINEWFKTTKSLDRIPDELLKALSKEAKENIVNIERIHRLDSNKKPNYSNKLTNDGNSLLLRNGLGYGKFDIHIYYSERSLEKINKFASKVNELYKPSPKPIETKEKKSEEISTELHENGMPKYIWERLSEKAKDNCINLKLLKNWTYKQVTNKITYTNFSITLRDEFGDEGVLYSYNKPKDFNGFIEKANKFYENLKVKEPEIKQEEPKQEEVKEVAPIITAASVPVSKLSSIAASDSTETIKRLVSMNITSMVQNLLLELLTEKTGKQKQELLKTKLKDFFKTSNGKTLIQLLVSGLIPHVLSHIPEKYREQVSSISDELRIQGETETVMFILDKVSNTISGKIITEFLNKNDLVRIDVSNNTNTSENRTLTSGQEDFNLYELQSSPLVPEKSAVVKLQKPKKP